MKKLEGWNEVRAQLLESGATEGELDRFNRVVSRRQMMGFVGRTGVLAALAGMGAGTEAVFRGLFGRGLIPVAWAEESSAETPVPGKPGMFVHGMRPVTGEFPPHLLDDDVTPSARHFVRNNGVTPERADALDVQGWKLVIDGEVHRPLALSLGDLKSFPRATHPLMLECGGNGRAFFEPTVRGNQWRRGAVACSQWTGARLSDVLERASLKETAVYTAHHGEDSPLGQAEPFSRGIPVEKALERHTLVAYEMNGAPLSSLNGFPVRLVVPGWIGSCSQKWLSRVTVRDRIHDSQKMTGYSYRVPARPVTPGIRPPEEEMTIATAWHIKSLITHPVARAALPVRRPVEVAGHAWAGEDRVTRVRVTVDFGISWTDADVHPPAGPYAWNRWSAKLTFAGPGYHEIWAQAFDDKGSAQPFRQPWNPKGYLGNVIHRLPVQVST